MRFNYEYLKYAYVLVGMMIIGLALARSQKKDLDFPFIRSMLFIRCILWPCLALVILLSDSYFRVLGQSFYLPILLFSTVPMAANNIAFAAEFDQNSEKTAFAVLFTTAVSMVHIPCIFYLSGLYMHFNA